MKNVYYMSERSFYGNNAGSKARNDLETIFEKNGFQSIGPRLERRLSKKITYYFTEYIRTKKIIRRLNKMKNEIIFFQYPVTKGKVINKYMEKICKNNKVVFFAHDIDYIRTKEYSLHKDEEINYLNRASCIILHNDTMINKLVSDGVKKEKIINLTIFDYLSNCSDNVNVKHENKYTIAYAGSLAKAKYLFEINQLDSLNYELHLFGDMISLEIKNKDIFYDGSYNPEELIKHLNCDFGLVWDGKSVVSSDDDLLQYTKFNNPHKASAYLAAGLPLIAWKESALANFVNKEKIGFTISSLDELNNVIGKISDDEYNKYKQNVIRLSQKIKTGYFANTAITKAIFLLEGK